MDNQIGFVIFLGICMLAILAAIVVGIIAAIKDEPRKKREAQAQMARQEEILSEELPAMEQVTACVVDLNCQVSMVGMQTPKTVKAFTVAFETEEGNNLLFNVPEEMYHGFEVGQRGVLTYVEDSLYGFELQLE